MSEKLPEYKVPEAEQVEADNRYRIKRKNLALLTPKKRKTAVLASARTKTVMYREVYDANEMPMSIGKLIWKEGQRMVRDREAKNVIEGAGNVWKFYKEICKRNSIDDMGMPIIQTVRFRDNPFKPYFNAFWDGEQMFYGTGDPKYTKSFTSDLDIIAHELTHGVIDYEAQLEYENQSGALNESFADVFGVLVKQWANNTAAKKSDWLIGSNILKGRNALRSLKSPGSAYKNDPIFGDDPQPAVMKDFVKLPNTEDGDWGGVHYNSGIPNHAFYIASMELAGNSWEKMGLIWYGALANARLMKANSNFEDAASATIKTATTLFGNNSLPVQAVNKGWKDVGVI
jgi:Zn-dependent metalloprotease